MEIKSTDLISLFEKSLSKVPQDTLDETGIVIQVGDNICKVYGLTNSAYNELIEFEGGNRGIVFDLGELYVSIFLLSTTIAVKELEVAKRLGRRSSEGGHTEGGHTEGIFTIPVGMQMLGRVMNVLGQPIDGLGDIQADQQRPIEAIIPSIMERSPVNESLETGQLVIDALIPIGRGQRELIIGNRNTGKTALAIDTIVHQKGKHVYCVYVSIGQRQANLVRIIRLLQQRGALEYTIIVAADSSETVLNQYLAPYVGCTMAEYLRDQGHDVLIVYDDLSSHAVAYREMSLLLRRSPGREAYPGDIFYLHSRLLERAGKLAKGGSITALPIVQIQSDDITAYIPTNLISITDGQLFLDTHLFNKGVRPAVNVELSVSRVGGAAQTKAIRKVSRALRLELAQYHELLDFAQFGTELDQLSQKRLARGAIIVELLKQPQMVTYSFVDQTLMLLTLKEKFLDDLALPDVHPFAVQLVSYVKSIYPAVYEAIESAQDVSDEVYQKLIRIVREFRKIFVSTLSGSSM